MVLPRKQTKSKNQPRRALSLSLICFLVYSECKHAEKEFFKTIHFCLWEGFEPSFPVIRDQAGRIPRQTF